MRSLDRLERCPRSLCRVQRPLLEPQGQPQKTNCHPWPQFLMELSFPQSHLDGEWPSAWDTWLEGAPLPRRTGMGVPVTCK